jgi:hypothetical protein
VEEKIKFSLDYLESTKENFEEKKEITIKIKREDTIIDTVLQIDKRFSPIKVNECVKEIVQKMDILKNYVDVDSDTSKIYQLWTILMIVKYFSELQVPKDFQKQVAVLEKLSDSGILFQIFSQFDEKEIQKIMAELDRITHIAMEKIKAYEPLFEDYEKAKALKE